MQKRWVSLQENIKAVVARFLVKSEGRETVIVSHFDTDGITSAAIMLQGLKRADRKFTVKIVKGLDEAVIKTLPKDKIILFLDLASNSLDHIVAHGLRDVFIVDHHEISQEIPETVEMINPHLANDEKFSSAGLVYMFCKEISHENKKFAKLAVLGMIGDFMDKEIDKLDTDIFGEDVRKKSGLLIYPSTRPLNRTLEYSSNPYIPSVTGSPEGVVDLLRGAGIEPQKGQYPSIMELTEEQMKNLVTGIMIRSPKGSKEIIGDIFLIKFFNKVEDARELSAMVNACSRLGKSDVALRFCMEVPEAHKEATDIHIKYKQHLISALEFVRKKEKIQGPGFVIINAENRVIDTIIGTVASILSNSALYEDGTVIITMAHYEDKVKVSARICGRSGSGRNLKDLLEAVIREVGGDVGGHEMAAGCVITKDKEIAFIDALKRNLEIEVVKI